MFVTFLKFTEKRADAPSFMAAHNGWIAQGFADGVFVKVLPRPGDEAAP